MTAGTPKTSHANQEEPMSSHTAQPAAARALGDRPRPKLALALALLSIPGVTITWDLSPIAGLVGTGVGLAAIAVGLKARALLAGAKGSRMATVAVAIAGLAVLSVVFFMIAGAPD